MRKTLFILFILISVLQIFCGLYFLRQELNFVIIHFAGLVTGVFYISMNILHRKKENPLLVKFLRYFFAVFIGLEIVWVLILSGTAIFLGIETVNLLFYLILILLVLHIVSGLWLNGKINKERKMIFSEEEAVEEK